MNETSASLKIRPAQAADLTDVIALDAEMTGIEKGEFWRNMFARLTNRPDQNEQGRHFLVAEDPKGGPIRGFIVGEVRAYEFGSDPCGWVIAIGVDPRFRVRRTGEKLFEAMCDCLRADGVATVRTMVAREDRLDMAFFRAQGMMAGPFIELEKPLD
jgi:ribosomal protein S18 acetylase RimI-like enzyme